MGEEDNMDKVKNLFVYKYNLIYIILFTYFKKIL